MKALQGVLYTTFEETILANPPDYQPVPWDGETMGEVLMRGNPILKGYLKNPEGTKKVFEGGWFHTGDLGVRHPNGYIDLKDRSKDIIISGGENISTIEVENVLYQNPAVLEAAVVAMPHEKWQETPCAFVTLKDGADNDGAGHHRFLPRQPRPLQVPDQGGVWAPAQDRHRQDPEIPAARAGEGDVGGRECVPPGPQSRNASDAMLQCRSTAPATDVAWPGAGRR